MRAGASVEVEYDEQGERVDVCEDGVPVLCYHHGVTEVPEGVDEVFERGGYVSSLYGPRGELLTEDFPADHVHHRAVNWSWATVKWKDDVRDMFAVRYPYTGPIVGGLWARPVRIILAEDTDDGGGVIEAESEWRWDDETAIVGERLLIGIHPKDEGGRFIDFEIRLTPLVDGLEFCGRLEAGYSGFNIRMAPGEGQRIAFYTDGADADPRMAWADYSAEFSGGDAGGEGSRRSGVAIVQHGGNPMYPQEWREYPALNFFQPLYPGGKLIPMPKGETITLRYRLWVHKGAATEEELSEVWRDYNEGPGDGGELKERPGE